ncbi:peroxisomal biogenesis factor 11 [Podospora didyma]|uniref:Peroxisomal biogenesis factor 11 n=1 Tax=Podospora didyma TaxID=330526 RepID=A0AAE0NHD0_9PEZI|nr:peroxisomal biogenesis factor 11 [Podospora didyma]
MADPTSMATVGLVEQFIKFTTDAAGLERTFRFAQAITQILIFVSGTTIVQSFFIALLSGGGGGVIKDPDIIPALDVLRGRFALGRRYFRLFRFLEAFRDAAALFSTSGVSSSDDASDGGRKKGKGRGLETWLMISARSFNGMYLLLESATFVDTIAAGAGAGGFGIWGQEGARVLMVEANRFWFVSLLCAAAAAVVRLKTMVREEEEGGGRKIGMGQDEKRGVDGGGMEETKKKENGKDSKRKTDTFRIVRRLVADVLDLAIPGSVVGWVPLSPGNVGLAMLGSTMLTGAEVWERCGKELAADRTRVKAS